MHYLIYDTSSKVIQCFLKTIRSVVAPSEDSLQLRSSSESLSCLSCLQLTDNLPRTSINCILPRVSSQLLVRLHQIAGELHGKCLELTW